MTDSKPLDLRTPDEMGRDAEIIAWLRLCESSLMLKAFESLGFENPQTIDGLLHALGLPDTKSTRVVLQQRLDYFVELGHIVVVDGKAYKANPHKWRSAIQLT